jgi:PhoPQ-activated pathogenicity-related protein
MQVAATGRVGGAIFLNSSDDYRAPDDLSFRLSPNVVAVLTRQYGESPETYFRGKTITVDGTVRRVLIVNRDDYFPRHILSANRWQHMVRILLPHQIVSVG